MIKINNQLQIFKNEHFGKVRTLTIDDEPYFVGKDVAAALGYTNPRKALIDHVDTEDKGVTKCDTLGGTQEMTIINESGLYSLIFGSKLEKAKEFKHWVTSKVLPSIRKTGSYRTTGVEFKDVLEVIRDLPNDNLKNHVASLLIANYLPVQEVKTVEYKKSKFDIKTLLDEFLRNDDVIIRKTENGVAVDRLKLYDFFGNYGFGKLQTLKKLDEENLIFHKEDCRTVQVRVPQEKNAIRVVIIKE